jgi:predicted component of type VI protein secretion system
MAKLILSMDGLVLKEIPLSKERTTIGRKPSNDIQIDNLAVSGEHAVIVTIMSDSFLEDLGSTNGTIVNGNPVKKHFLQNNDVIELGKYKLKFLAEPGVQPAASAADFEKTMVLRPSAMKAVAEQARAAPQTAEQARAAAAQQAAGAAASAGTLAKDAKAPTPPPAASASPAPARAAAPAGATSPSPGGAAGAPRGVAVAPSGATSTSPGGAAAAPAGAPAAPAAAPGAAPAEAKPAPLLGAIQILSGSNAGKALELVKPLTTLGKPGVQVAVLTRRPQGYFITHVEGAKQPSVNGQSIGNAPHALKDHDVIELAGVKMEFFVKS